MRRTSGCTASPAPRLRRLGVRAVAVLLLTWPTTAAAQAGRAPAAALDSAALVERAREEQAAYERFRQSRIPVERREAQACDERIGRLCIWFGGAGEEDFPDEPPETEQARRALLGVLLETARELRDPWVWGQLIHYMVEHGDLQYAEQSARACVLAEPWWCSALLGYALHVRDDFVGAEVAFREALGAMPEAVRLEWSSPRYVLPPAAVEALERLDPAVRERRLELFWTLSDPLFLVEGNDRLTDHFARLVEARNRADATNPQLMEWDVDLEETLVRYGRAIGYGRSHDPEMTLGRAVVRDTRRVQVHHHPMSRGYLFPEEFLESPSEIPPESWITAPRRARTWYAPPYAPDFGALETQVGRFRRGTETLVVGAYRPARPGGDELTDPFAGVPDDARAALFLVPEDGGEVLRVDADGPAGVVTMQAPHGRWVSSLEVLAPAERRAWRARQGVRQEPLTPGLVGVSDLLILTEGAPLPETLEEAIPHVRPGVRVRRGERFAVVWEVYGLAVREPVEVTVGITRGRPGFLERVGEFLGILEGDRAVEITFDEQGQGGVQAAFRSLEIELPDFEPGEYTLHLRLDLTGREPTITSRPIVVEG